HEAEGEWRILLNLTGLLFGFAILAKHFESSGVPNAFHNFLPKGWQGGFVLLLLIAAISTFLDNIAAAIIGGKIAQVVYKGRVHTGYLAAIIAASNAGGAGSVLGDTTTTMMWIEGVSALEVSNAFFGSIAAILIFGMIAAQQQAKVQQIELDESMQDIKIDFKKIAIVGLILAGAILANWTIGFPAIGIWVAIIIGASFSNTNWDEIPKAIKGTVFLLSLVASASLMPVGDLPVPSWETTFGLGFVSAVFDNIPLTKLCIEQGGYDWGFLAFAVGFGGSMIWFGSSAGVALSNMFPQAKSTLSYLKNGWHIAVAYIVAFFVMLLVVGWNPSA
ncbi:MAG TPA: citrate transporter, partial [Bacteroidales bacterium]|nr:citrate transporter [Bacteroidales bacterium]